MLFFFFFFFFFALFYVWMCIVVRNKSAGD